MPLNNQIPNREAGYGVIPPGQSIKSSTSTARMLENVGMQLITSTAAFVQLLTPPYAGAVKQFIKTTTSSALAQVVVNSTATLQGVAGSTSTYVGRAGANTTLTFSAIDQSVTLFAGAANRWDIVSNVGSVDCS